MTDAHIPTKEEIERLVNQGMTKRQMAKHYGVCYRTIEHWRRKRGVQARAKAGGPPKKIPSEKIDALLREGKLTQGQIAIICGCSIMSVSLRWQVIKPEWAEEKYKAEIDRPVTLYHPYADQVREALKGYSREFLQSEEGQRFLARVVIQMPRRRGVVVGRYTS